jgi:hypothetical protein
MGKTLSQMRADLRTDLKDSGSLWTDAELNRCIEKAVADLSRYLPRQMYYDLTLEFEVTGESFTTPAAADADYIVDAEDLSAVSDGSTATITNRTLDVPRPVKITITDTDSSITSFTIIVKGTDEEGKYAEESFYFSGGLTQTGKKYFKTVTEVEIDHIAGNGAGDLLDVGTGTHEGVFVALANKPIKPESETVKSSDESTTYTRDSDYTMDWARGRIAVKSGGSMAAGTSYKIDYDKSKISIDLSSLPDFISFNRAIYPAKQIPQSYVPVNLFGDILTIEGEAGESQTNMFEENHIIIEYHARHTPPSDDAPGSYRDFLDETILLAASGYALIIKSLQQEHQAVTDLASMRTALSNISAIHNSVSAALDKVATYLETNTEGTSPAVDMNAKALIDEIREQDADLRAAINTALDAANTYIDNVASDLTNAENVWSDEERHLTNKDGTVVAEDAEDFITTGKGKINTINVGENVPELYRRYAETEIALSRTWAQKRADFLDEAGRRTAAAAIYIQEAAQRLSNLRSYLEQANAYMRMAEDFISEARSRLVEIDSYLSEAAQYASAANTDLAIADRFRAEGMLRLEEARRIWRDPTQYVGDFSFTSVSQPGG